MIWIQPVWKHSKISLIPDRTEKKLILTRLKDPVHGILQFSLGQEFPDVSMSRLSVERAVRLARVRGIRPEPRTAQTQESGLTNQ